MSQQRGTRRVYGSNGSVDEKAKTAADMDVKTIAADISGSLTQGIHDITDQVTIDRLKETSATIMDSVMEHGLLIGAATGTTQVATDLAFGTTQALTDMSMSIAHTMGVTAGVDIAKASGKVVTDKLIETELGRELGMQIERGADAGKAIYNRAAGTGVGKMMLNNKIADSIGAGSRKLFGQQVSEDMQAGTYEAAFEGGGTTADQRRAYVERRKYERRVRPRMHRIPPESSG